MPLSSEYSPDPNLAICVRNLGKKYTIGGPQEK
jgi:hypothetical protein